MLHSYLRDRKDGVTWEKGALESMSGQISYCRMVERDYIDHMLQMISEKHNINIHKAIKADLRNAAHNAAQTGLAFS